MMPKTGQGVVHGPREAWETTAGSSVIDEGRGVRPFRDEVAVMAAVYLDPSPNPIARLVQLVRSNERLFADLQEVGVRLRSARRYLATPGCNPILGRAHLDRLRIKHAGLRAVLRANRREAHHLLGVTEGCHSDPNTAVNIS